MRSGNGAQSFPVVVSNVTTRDDVVEIGFVFGKLRRRHYQAIGDLMFGDVEEIAAFRQGRRRRRGINHGVAMFFIWSYMGFVRGAKLLAVEWRARRAAKAQPALIPAAEPAPVAEPALVVEHEIAPPRAANG